MRKFITLCTICITLVHISCQKEVVEIIKEDKQIIYDSNLLKSVDENIDNFEYLKSLCDNNKSGVWLIDGGITLTENITLPVGVTLASIGGGLIDLNGYNITGQATKIECGDFAIFHIFNSGSLTGTWDLDDTPPEWFGYDNASTNIERFNAMQAAVSISRVIKLKAKEYYLEGTLTKENYYSLTLKGEGMGNTRLIFTTDVDGLNYLRDSTRSDTDYFEGVLYIKDMSIETTSDAQQAAAIRTVHRYKQPALILNNVEIKGTGGGEWKYGIHMTNATESSFNNVIIRGKNIDKMYAVYMRATNAAVSYTFNGLSIYNAHVGMRFVNDTKLGIEGIKISDCDIVNAYRGIHFSNSTANYVPPQINIVNTHINAHEINILIEKATQVYIGVGTLLYNRGVIGNFIKFNNVSEFSVSDIYCSVIENGDVVGVDVSGNVASGKIHGVFKMKAGSSKQVVYLRSGVENVVVDIKKLTN